MNQKHLQINTDFFGDQNAQIFKSNLIQESHLTAKSASSAVHARKSQIDNHINSYKYQYIPDHQHSHYAAAQSVQGDYIVGSSNAKKLQGAYVLQNTLSRMTASLFISCWESLKALLPQYESLIKKQDLQRTYESLKNEQVLKDFNHSEYPQSIYISNQNHNIQLIKKLQTNQQRKKQIMERQNRGIRLDQLSKQRQNRSKSVYKIIPQKDVVQVPKTGPFPQRTNTNVTFNNQITTIQNNKRTQNINPVQQKSYRQKFEQYKHRNKSVEQKNYQIKNIQKDNQYKKIYQDLNIHRIVTQNSNPQNDKNIYHQRIHNGIGSYGEYNRKYIVNHPINLYGNYSQLFSYRSPANTPLNSYRQNYHQQNIRYQHEPHMQMNYYIQQQYIDQNQKSRLIEQQLIRARLLQEITQKLKKSRIKLQGRQTRNLQQLQMIKKLSKLQKMITGLRKQQGQNRQQINNKPHKKQEQLLLKKFMQQISIIRQQINHLKINKTTHSYSHYDQYPNTQNDYEWIKVINQQQQLLNKYQQQYQKLLKLKQSNQNNNIKKTLIIQQHSEQKSTIKTNNQSILKSSPPPNRSNLIRQQNNSHTKINSSNVHLINQNSSQFKKQINLKNQTHLNNSQTSSNQIVYKSLYYDGKNQAYETNQYKKREQQIRIMVQRVRIMRGEQKIINKTQVQQINGSYRPIRQKYEEQYKKLSQNEQKSSFGCCQLMEY